MARSRGVRNMGGTGTQSHAGNSQVSGITELPVNTSDDEDVSSRKRQRVSKACDRCRQGKLKCNGATPRCGTCVKSQKSCSYGVTSKRRGLRSGYVRALECLLGITFQAIRGSQDTVEKLIQQTSRKSFWARDDTGDSSEAAGSPLETWKSSKVPRALDNLLAAPDELNDETPLVLPWELQLKLTTRTEGTTGSIQSLTKPNGSENVPETICARCRIQASNQERQRMSTGYNDRNYSAQNPFVLNLQPGQINSSYHALPRLPENPLQLLDRYFAFTHSWFPVVDKSAVQKSLFTYRNVLTGNRSMDCKHGDMALLWAVFAYADYQLRPSGNSSLSISIQEIEDFVKYRKPSQRDGNPSVQHLQALLIIGLLHYSWQNWNNARLVTGEALAIGEHLGLDSSEILMSKSDRLTWLGCFLLDTITAAHVGRVPWISSRRIRGLLHVDDTGGDEWEPWRLKEALVPGTDASLADFLSPIHTITVFMKLMELICIQNDLIRFPVNNSEETHVQALLAWNKQLPEHIKACLDTHSMSTQPNSTQPPNVLNLVIFHATIIASLSSSNMSRNHQIPLHTGVTEKESGPVPEEGPNLQFRGFDWSHMTAHSAVPTQIDSHAIISPSNSTLPDRPQDTNIANDFSIGEALGYLSNWDDIEL